MKVKICGVCRPEDARLIAEAGADFLGVICVPRGPRQQSIEHARVIFDAAPGIARAGVFADQPVGDVAATAQTLDLDVIQLHGREPSDFINQLEAEVDCVIWKSVTLRSADDLSEAIDRYADHVDGLHLDAETGGSGRRFTWELAARARELLPAHVQLIVAGGLSAENVGQAIQSLQPDVVDVASGVEITVGEKSPEKIQAFLRNARR